MGKNSTSEIFHVLLSKPYVLKTIFKLRLSYEAGNKIYDSYSSVIWNNKSFTWNVYNEITGRAKKDDNLVIQHDGNVLYDTKNANAFQQKFNGVICDTAN